MLPQRPARFSLTDAAPWRQKKGILDHKEKEKCAGPVMPGKLMPLGQQLSACGINAESLSPTCVNQSKWILKGSF